MTEETPQRGTHSVGRFAPAWLWLSWLIVVSVAGWFEYRRWLAASASPAGPSAWFVVWDIETTPPFLAFFLLPLFWFAGKPKRVTSGHTLAHKGASFVFRVGGAALVFVLSLAASRFVGRWPVEIGSGLQKDSVAFSELPPAYHDEYSYLLQARTFLDGRLSYPPMTVRPDLFHQMHVLNEYRTVSRYFPLTGAWIAPFEAIGKPVQGHWLAGALAAVFFFLSLLQLGDFRAAIFGGVLIALSPGIAVFSNLLLSHHPTMLALSIFTCAFFRLMSTDRGIWGVVAGTGLALAMVGRPMTAAGFALPFGLWLMIHILRSPWWTLVIAFALPLMCGFGVLAVCNHAATGSYMRTAYQEYTDTYTPSHRYGFYNVVVSDKAGKKVLTAYDDWATNLTPEIAIENVEARLFYSAQWALAIFPLAFGVLMSLPQIFKDVRNSEVNSCERSGAFLLFAAVITMHLAHVPYWFDGIMHWHYVFETAPLMLMLCGVGLSAAVRVLQKHTSLSASLVWCVIVVAAGLVPAWIRLPFCDNTSKISAAVNEMSFARARLHAFRQHIESGDGKRPALVLVDERGSDPQLSYVINDPQLRSELIVCRLPETDAEIAELRDAFPDRTLYRFSPKSMQFEELKFE